MIRSGNTITCYQGQTSTVRWTNTFNPLSGYTVTYSGMPSTVTGNATITAKQTAASLKDPSITGSKLSKVGQYRGSWTVTNQNEKDVTCYYKVGGNSYSTTTIAARGTFRLSTKRKNCKRYRKKNGLLPR